MGHMVVPGGRGCFLWARYPCTQDMRAYWSCNLSTGYGSKREAAFKVLQVLRAPDIGPHRKLFCSKTMLPFGSHQAPLYRVSRQPAKEYLLEQRAVTSRARETVFAMRGEKGGRGRRAAREREREGGGCVRERGRKRERERERKRGQVPSFCISPWKKMRP